jgi:putative membrane protein
MLLKKAIPLSYFFQGLIKHILSVLLLSLIVGYVHKFFFSNLLVPLSMTSLLGISISILLAFRTNQAYDRWWEARKIWGLILTDSRVMVREVINFLGVDIDQLHAYNQERKLKKCKLSECGRQGIIEVLKKLKPASRQLNSKVRSSNDDLFNNSDESSSEELSMRQLADSSIVNEIQIDDLDCNESSSFYHKYPALEKDSRSPKIYSVHDCALDAEADKGQKQNNPADIYSASLDYNSENNQGLAELKFSLINHVASMQINYPHMLGEYLRAQTSIYSLEKYFNKEDESRYTNATNRVNLLLLDLGQLIKLMQRKSLISHFEQIQLDSTLNRLTIYLGKCERIKNTPFPRSYSVILHSLIYVFVVILPISLSKHKVIEVTLLNMVVATMFFMIEKTCLKKEDPFENRPSDVSMTALAYFIEQNILELTGREDLRKEQPANDYYVL